MPKKAEKTEKAIHFVRKPPGGLVGGGCRYAKPGEAPIDMEKPWHETKPVRLRKLRDR